MISFTTGIFRATPFILQYLFVGQVFYWHTQATFAPGNTYYQFKLVNTRMYHFIKQIYQTGGTGITVQLIENPALVDGNVHENTFNAQRELTNSPFMTIFNNPAAIVGGTIIESSVLVQYDKSEQSVDELILDRNKTYILKIINSGAGNVDVNINIVWYESSN